MTGREDKNANNLFFLSPEYLLQSYLTGENL